LEITYLKNRQLENRQLENINLANEKYSTWSDPDDRVVQHLVNSKITFKNKYNGQIKLSYHGSRIIVTEYS